MDIFKTRLLNNRQRWTRACCYGGLATILSIIIGASIQRFLHLNMSITHLCAGFFIGWVIREAGHGVKPKFVYLAAVYTVIAILFIDVFTFTGFSVMTDPIMIVLILYQVLISYLSISVNSLLSLILKITSVFIAMQTARIS